MSGDAVQDGDGQQSEGDARRVTLRPAALRILRSLPRTTVYTGLEILFLALLAIQCARLFWTLATPVGPLGEWRATGIQPPRAIDPQAFAVFDPFFRLDGGGGPMQVTALAIKLFGVREDQASGRGSAIISTPDGQQRSFAVGDEIMPGVVLKSVAFDSVTISRSGSDEQLFLDQSSPAPASAPVQGVVGPTTSVSSIPPSPPPPVPVRPSSQVPVITMAPPNAVPPRTTRAVGPLRPVSNAAVPPGK
ncbi:type II secretion system protein N [Allosphingosinicella vermicomposti]|uniref:type II secretion system protein N n=1 Tax=Allosphingosinicella vermicomposti TaxID=614671 RepID=UPI000D1146FC|nr:type II secretion system protein N [Allosphingosinicella vermicomposti]